MLVDLLGPPQVQVEVRILELKRGQLVGQLRGLGGGRSRHNQTVGIKRTPPDGELLNRLAQVPGGESRVVLALDDRVVTRRRPTSQIDAVLLLPLDPVTPKANVPQAQNTAGQSQHQLLKTVPAKMQIQILPRRRTPRGASRRRSAQVRISGTWRPDVRGRSAITAGASRLLQRAGFGEVRLSHHRIITPGTDNARETDRRAKAHDDAEAHDQALIAQRSAVDAGFSRRAAAWDRAGSGQRVRGRG